MAYEKITGTVAALSRSGKNIQLDDGEWYGAFAAKQIPEDIQVGDTVKFDMQANDKGDKTFLNIKGDVKLISEGGRDNEEEDEAPRSRSTARNTTRAPARDPAPRTSRSAAPERNESRGTPARGARTGATTSGGSDPRQTSIVRQSSVTAALRVLELSDALRADFQELPGSEAAEFVIEIARVFEAYGTSTD